MSVLNTSRIRLRRLENTDLEQLHALFSDAEVMKYLDDFMPYTREKSESALKNAQASYGTFGYGPWALIHRATDGFVGIGGIEMLPQRRYPEITYIIGRNWWGQGLASEIATSLVAYGFDALGLETLGASVDPRNAASVRIIKKLGMSHSHNGRDEFGMPAAYYLLERTAYLENVARRVQLGEPAPSTDKE